jgi:hypothetical protein
VVVAIQACGVCHTDLTYREGGIINIGWYCSDRICQLGKSEKTALIWEGTGEPPAWVMVQVNASGVPLILASQIPQAHVRGLRLHHRDNNPQKDQS